MSLDPKKIAELRKKISALSKEDALNEFKGMNAIISLPVLIAIMEEIKQSNEQEMEAMFLSITGKNLRKSKKSMEETLEGIIGKDIQSFFKKFIEQNNIAEITDKNIEELMEGIADDFSENQFFEQDENSELFLKLLKTEIFLICALALYKDNDWRQNARKYQLISMLAMKENDIRKPFLAISLCAQEVYITQKIKHLWEEAMLWLDGLHYRVFMQMPKVDGKVLKESNGRYPTIKDDDEDANFKNHFGLCKYDICLYHLETKNALQARLSLLSKHKTEEVKDGNAEKPEIQGQLLMTSTQKNKKDDSPSVLMEISGIQETNTPALIDSIKHLVPDATIRILKQNELLKSTTMFAKKNQKEEIPFELLSKYQKESENIKFSKLTSMLDKYCLNEDQINDLKNFKGIILSEIDSYIKSAYTTYKLPTLFVPRTHLALAERLRGEIQHCTDPVKIASTLFYLWNQCKSENSVDMTHKTTLLLDQIYTIVLRAAQPQKQEIRLAKVS